MSEQKQDAQAEKPLNLYQKLAKITGEVGAIKKGGHNSEQKFDFIEYAAVAGELRGLFAKYNVLIVPYMQKASHQTRKEITSKYGAKGQHVVIDFTFVVYNADDPTEKFSVTWTGEAIDYGDKAITKAATSALKYYLMRQFNISEKGDDADAVSPDLGGVSKTAPAKGTRAAKAVPETAPARDAPATPPQKAKIFKLLTGYRVNHSAMNAVLMMQYDVADPEHMTSAEASRVIDAIQSEPPKVVADGEDVTV